MKWSNTNPQTNKVRHLRVIGLVLLALFFAVVVIGIYLSIYGLTAQQFDTISPPDALSRLQLFSMFWRLASTPTVFLPKWIVATTFFFLPVLGMLICSIYFIIKRKYQTFRSIFSWILISIFTIALADIVFFLFIPTYIQMGTFRIVAGLEVSKGKELLTKNSVITDINKIISKISNTQQLNLYADYGSGGAILVSIIDNNKGSKLTYFQSFYLPVFFSEHKINTGQDIMDKAELILVNNTYLVFGNATNKNTLEKTLPLIGDKLLNMSYEKWISKSTGQLKTFSVIDDKDFKSFYIQKSESDIKRMISINQSDFQINKATIDGYPSTVVAIDAEYKKFVTDEEADYQYGCVDHVIYTDCVKSRQTIDQNKINVEQDRSNALINYNQALQYNQNITSYLSDERKQLTDFESNDRNSLENNKGEYSVGLAFDNNTIYLRYFEDVPISGEDLRIITHELLHIYSYNGTSFLPPPLDEGMTDYFATKALGYNELDSIRTSGYPLEIQVIMALLEKIPQDDLMNVYFSKDESQFKSLMKKYFPKTNYVDFIANYQKIYEGTFHVNGLSHSFDKALIDHEDVVKMRKSLGLSEKKFDHIIY